MSMSMYNRVKVTREKILGIWGIRCGRQGRQLHWSCDVCGRGQLNKEVLVSIYGGNLWKTWGEVAKHDSGAWGRQWCVTEIFGDVGCLRKSIKPSEIVVVNSASVGSTYKTPATLLEGLASGRASKPNQSGTWSSSPAYQSNCPSLTSMGNGC